jgi:acetyl-CoA acyltransferase 2
VRFARRASSTADDDGTLAKLPTVFKKDGTVTAGNASGICDGAAALILVSRQTAEAKGYKPLDKLTAWGVAGCDPTVMGIGPVPAIQNLLAVSGTHAGRLRLVRRQRGLCAAVLAVEKELGLPRAQTNVNGGAIALGHPLGASGARITAHLVHELRRRGGKRAIGAACIGGGQGIAVAVESV